MKKNFGKKVSQCRKKLKGGTLWVFPTSILSQNSKKLKWGPFGEIFSAKKSQCRKKTERGDPLVLPGMVCYAGKQEKPFWFSSLGQMVQFGAIIFCTTILVSSGGLKKTLTKSHDYSRLISKEKRRLKISLHVSMQQVKSSSNVEQGTRLKLNAKMLAQSSEHLWHRPNKPTFHATTNNQTVNVL